MGDWNLFFATSAGSAATLVGLLFVATQLHLGVFRDPASRWGALAQVTLTLLAVNFALSLFLIMPGIALAVRGDVILAIVVFAIYRSVRIWWPVMRLGEKGRRHRIAQSFWLLVLPFIAYADLAFGAVGLVGGSSPSLGTVGGAFLFLFAIALRNAWRLVVSVEASPPPR
jgi:hypothetical protein